MDGYESMRMLVRVALAAQTGTYDQLSDEDARWAYGYCVRTLSPQDMADAVGRYCEQVSPVERAALATLFHEGFEHATDPRVRLWLHVDPQRASAAQVARMHTIAQRLHPRLLDRLFGPDGTDHRPAATHTLAGIAAEAAAAVLARRRG